MKFPREPDDPHAPLTPAAPEAEDPGAPVRSDLVRRRRWYLALMGTCAVLVALAWNLVRLWSTDVAVGMSVVAALLPPIAVIVANSRPDT